MLRPVWKRLVTGITAEVFDTSRSRSARVTTSHESTGEAGAGWLSHRDRRRAPTRSRSLNPYGETGKCGLKLQICGSSTSSLLCGTAPRERTGAQLFARVRGSPRLPRPPRVRRRGHVSSTRQRGRCGGGQLRSEDRDRRRGRTRLGAPRDPTRGRARVVARDPGWFVPRGPRFHGRDLGAGLGGPWPRHTPTPVASSRTPSLRRFVEAASRTASSAPGGSGSFA
jgi:hypothetical protein